MISNEEDEEKFVLFVEFLVSDEWLLPVNDFIEENCLIFSTSDQQEFKDEKREI